MLDGRHFACFTCDQKPLTFALSRVSLHPMESTPVQAAILLCKVYIKHPPFLILFDQ
jgi:hypothetical protein